MSEVYMQLILFPFLIALSSLSKPSISHLICKAIIAPSYLASLRLLLIALIFLSFLGCCLRRDLGNLII